MKLPETLNPRNLLKKDKKGVALVTVLTVMALTTILVMTFFSLATSEHRASNTYSQGLQAQQVGEQAVNMVIAQIREATTVGTTKAWASQPGAIRQWDQGGNKEFAYKLYSDDNMKTLNWGDFQTDFLDANGWSRRPSHFVDLNEPVIRGEKVYYPIVHPAASTIPAWPKPLGNDKNGVEGFSYNQGAMKLIDQGKVGGLAAGISKAEGHVAMPVRWIYQLADGTLGVLNDSPSGGAGGDAYGFRPIAGQGTPSETNPMVARFAFWADDETSKLNINTHAGGLAWDTPKAGGELDMSMGKYQPAQKEWQRYPGHPASTHLAPALAPGVLDIVNDRDAMEMLYRVVPRIVGGGSESGTRLIDTRRREEENGLVADREPLFPTIDDVVMRSDRKPHEFPNAQGAPIPDQELSDYLERSKFFITANSRAPETNMFNLPRVAIWPIYNADSNNKSRYNQYLTPFDQLIHYCASMGKSPGGAYPRYEYLFKRENADSTIYDYNNITRNKELYAYLLDLLERPVPGYGNSFSNKYSGGGHRQLLTEIFDYIRTTNLHDDTLYREDFSRAFQAPNTATHLSYTNARDNNDKAIGLKGHGQVVPIKINETKGFGRFYSVSAVQIQVISCAEPDDMALPRHMGSTSYRNRIVVPPSAETIYMNFPPMPVGFAPGMPRYEEFEPLWLKTLRLTNAPLYAEAFKPENWNWQLAYLDPLYFNSVVGNPRNARTSDPRVYKFQRTALTPLNLTTPDPNNPFTRGDTRLGPTEQLVQGAFLFNLFTPSVGWNSINPDMEIEIEIGDTSQFRFRNVTGTPQSTLFGDFIPFIGFDQSPVKKWTFATNRVDSAWGGRRYGGTMPFEYSLAVPTAFTNEWLRTLLAPGAPQINNNKDVTGGRSRLTWLDRGYEDIPNILTKLKVQGSQAKIAKAYRYDLVTVPFKINGALKEPGKPFYPGLIDFTGGDVTFSFYHGGENSEASAPQGGAAIYGVQGGELIQRVTIEVPKFQHSGTSPEGPLGRRPVIYDPALGDAYRSQHGAYFNEFDALEKDSFSFLERNNLGADPGNNIVATGTRTSRLSTLRGTGGTQNPFPVGRFAQISVNSRPSPFGVGDVVKSVEVRHGDARMVAGKSVVAKGEAFEPHRFYNTKALAHSQTNAVGGGYYGAAIEKNYLIIPNLPGNSPYRGRAPLPFGGDDKNTSDKVQLYGDFDNGAGLMIDGPYINKPDEGNTHSLRTKFVKAITDVWDSRRDYGEFPYFNREDLQEAGGPAYFSPNRLVSGPGMFGSLPTRLVDNQPWQTLLFRPALEGTTPGTLTHPGGQSPPDHLIMDLFWMPVVEPYAISEPLSTAGKVNLNFQMVPFLHVNRSTALRGVFRSEFILCVPNRWHGDYKHDFGRGTGYHWRDNPFGGALQGKRLRAAIKEDETLDQFVKRFDDGNEIFKSSTAICEIHLIPEEISTRLGQGSKGAVGSYTPSVAEMNNGKYWRDHALIGDNSRERPYTNIQARVTTKSNTFLVHYRAQVIKQSRRDSSGEYAVWRPGTDSVQAEYRGSSLVERYVNPDSLNPGGVDPDFASGNPTGLDKYYRYRVANPRRFAP
jgi:hypothetical protein